MNDGVAVVCINLARRPDRLIHCKSQLESQKFLIFPAIDGQNLSAYKNDIHILPFLKLIENKSIVFGEFGCKMSHYCVIQLIANENSLQNVLILEDDIILNNNELIHKLSECIQSYKFEWDIIYVGGQWTPEYGINSKCHIKDHEITYSNLNEYFLQKDSSKFYKRIKVDFDIWNSPYFRTAGAYLLNKNSSRKIIQLIMNNKDEFISSP